MLRRLQSSPRKATPGRAGLRAASALAMLACVLAGNGALAQYKWVDSDGTVHYGDRPAPSGREAQRVSPPAPAPSASVADLPYRLRDAAQRYPVTLYTINDCAPCETARKHLLSRGVPFSEKTVNRAPDQALFRSLGFSDPSFPTVVIGRERLVGFDAQSWTNLLDAAGYPPASQLPGSWRQPPATPLAPTAAGAAVRAPGEARTGAAGEPGSTARAGAQGAKTAPQGIEIPPPPPPGSIRF
jgi:glutaredoxin